MTWIKHKRNGITSTYVENTPQLIGVKWKGEDHLHIRGEYQLLLLKMVLAIGSPPHTWRILASSAPLDSHDGITSTYVENTVKNVLGHKSLEDHLPIRGEYKPRTICKLLT